MTCCRWYGDPADRVRDAQSASMWVILGAQRFPGGGEPMSRSLSLPECLLDFRDIVLLGTLPVGGRAASARRAGAAPSPGTDLQPASRSIRRPSPRRRIPRREGVGSWRGAGPWPPRRPGAPLGTSGSKRETAAGTRRAKRGRKTGATPSLSDRGASRNGERGRQQGLSSTGHTRGASVGSRSREAPRPTRPARTGLAATPPRAAIPVTQAAGAASAVVAVRRQRRAERRYAPAQLRGRTERAPM